MLDKLTLEEKSYIIGLFQGDSSLYLNTRNRGKLTYEIALRDKDIIFKLQKLLSKHVNVFIHQRNRNTNFKNNVDTLSLTIYNLEFRKELNKYIPYGKKDNIIKPYRDLIIEDYIRGLIDADGSIGFKKDGCYCSLCTSSEDIKNYVLDYIKKLLKFEKRLNRNTRDNIYNIVLYNEDAQKYLDKIYGNAKIYIDRKYEAYLKNKKWRRSGKKNIFKKKSWLKWEDDFILLKNVSIEEKIKKLKRTKKSIQVRHWRLTGYCG